ncbi:MAG: FxsA family protein [Inquilinaceae bacterium]
MVYVFLLLLLTPLAEIFVFIQLGGLVGAWPTIAGIVATAIIGTALIRRQGLQTLNRARATADRGEPPVRELFDGLCLLVAGALLLTPGFITDGMGFLLLVPPLRAILGRHIWGWLERRGGLRAGPTRPGGPAGPGRTVIDADFEDVTNDGAETATKDSAPKDGPRLPDSRWGRG